MIESEKDENKILLNMNIVIFSTIFNKFDDDDVAMKVFSDLI